MDNKQFPEQEDSGILPEEMTDVPPQMEQLEDVPVIEELSFEEESPVMNEIPLVKEIPDAEEPPISGEIPVIAETPEAEEIPAADTPVEALEPQAAPVQEILTHPEIGLEITPDDNAMDYHGMLGHGEEEPPFDMSILDDPDLNPPEEPLPAEEIHDQEYRDNGQDFEAMFNAPAPEKKKPDYQRPAHKGRPKRKKGEGLFGIPNILVTVVWLALIVAIGVTAGRMLWVCAADVLAFGREDKAVTITIYEADTMDDIIDKLYDNELIRYKSLFKFYADISDAEEDIQPGIYDLNTRYDYHALVNFMSPRSSREVIRVTIPEGYTCRQIFDLLEENRICTAVDIAAYAADGELEDYWFLENVARGDKYCLEGFLFPDTYDFYKNSTPREALEKLLDGFEYRFTEEMRAQIDTLNANVTDGSFTVREIAIVASLIEKESAAPGESPRVSGVIYNRLFNWGSNPAYLNIDASIVYALGGKSELTKEDLQMDSPYNTYTNIGLTPTPISNPGLSSLKAALEPESHNYYYYVLNPSTGMHTFATTYEEHSANVAAYSEE